MDYRMYMVNSLESEWKDCERCPLHCERNKVVIGEGTASPILFTVAEAPGQVEDETGRTLWGPAGTIYRRVSRAEGILITEETFMSNVVACRPPGNRSPRKYERDECWPRLENLIGITNPHALLLMGKTAMKLLEGVPYKDSLSAWRGKIPKENWPLVHMAWNLRLVYLTYHPSWVLRQPTKQKKRMALREFQKDIRQVAKVVGHFRNKRTM